MKERMAVLAAVLMMISLFTGTGISNVRGQGDPTDHDPITIESNNGFNSTNGVTSGSGIEDDPYIIEGWKIDGGEYRQSIYIANTTSFFVIRDCTLYDSVTDTESNMNKGIHLLNVTNGAVEDCYFHQNDDHDISLEGCLNCTVKGNVINSKYWTAGIALHSTSHCLVEDNICDPLKSYQDYYGNFTPKLAADVGIAILDDCTYNMIRDNRASNYSMYGISVNYEGTIGNIIEGNTVTYNDMGIKACGTGTMVRDNIAMHNDDGIFTHNTIDVHVTNNFCSENFVGIKLWSPEGEGMECTDNIVIYNERSGINVNCEGSVIHNNNLSENGMFGMEIYEEKVEVYSNIFMDNSREGIQIFRHSGAVDDAGSLVYWNNFIGNGGSYQATDELALSFGYYWDRNGKGNYWDDHTSPDNDMDGIVDDPLSINGSAPSIDNYPVAEPFDIYVAGPRYTPVLSGSGPTTIKAGSNYTATFTAEDRFIAGGSLQWILETNASFLTISDGLLTGSPDTSDTGEYWINVTVRDRSEFDFKNYTLTVESDGQVIDTPVIDDEVPPDDQPDDVEADDDEPADDTSDDIVDDDKPDDDTDDHTPVDMEIEISDGEIREGESFQLSAEKTDHGLSGEVEYRWFIDGKGLVGTGETIEIELEEGIYVITLEVTNDEGRIVKSTRVVEVKGAEENEHGLMFIISGITIVCLILFVMIIGMFFLKKRRRDTTDEGQTLHTGVDLAGTPTRFEGNLHSRETGSLDPVPMTTELHGRNTAISIDGGLSINDIRDEVLAIDHVYVNEKRDLLKRARRDKMSGKISETAFEELRKILEE